MAVKKSELYSKLWAACDRLRGGVEPSRYKDYVLLLLFFKYASDKYKGQDYADFRIEDGASFDDLIEARNKPDVGERVDKIIQKFLRINDLVGVLPDVSFNNPDEMGTGKAMVDKVSGLIGIFQDKALDFKNNRASGDDIIGDAYEYFMSQFAQESGKSKGQFYTPSEVSRVIARLIGIGEIDPGDTGRTLYDPACGSGSLLIRAADEAPKDSDGNPTVTIYGQDISTSGFAKMNLVLHRNATGSIAKGNTLTDPSFKDTNFGSELQRFDFVVMNPPFSDKDWSDGLVPGHDIYNRFQDFGIPPAKQGDFAWFLHVLKSLKSDGKAGIVMPHGVLFRGDTEETIRKNILSRHWIKGIVSLPPNLFYGTSIPACIIIIDKENADDREGIFMIDASSGGRKDGSQNRLREQDIEKIVRVFNARQEVPGFSHFATNDEIDANDGNLNIPRYVKKLDDKLPQDITAHLYGGIPERDINSLRELWEISAPLKERLFKRSTDVTGRGRIFSLALPPSDVGIHILMDESLQCERDREICDLFAQWENDAKAELLTLNSDTNIKVMIRGLVDRILEHYHDARLVDPYAAVDCLMNYWNEQLQDDVYIICADGYEAAHEIEDDWFWLDFEGLLIPKAILEREYFSDELKELDVLREKVNLIDAELQDMCDEEGGEDGLLSEVLNEKGAVTKSVLTARLREINKKNDTAYDTEEAYLLKYKSKLDQKTATERKVKDKRKELDAKLRKKYADLTLDEIKHLLFDLKWMAKIKADITAEVDKTLGLWSARIELIAKCYESTLGELETRVDKSRDDVRDALAKMGYKS